MASTCPPHAPSLRYCVCNARQEARLPGADLCAAPRPPASTWSASRCGRAGWGSRAPAGCPRSAASAGRPRPAARRRGSPTAPCGPVRAAPRQRPGAEHVVRWRWEPFSRPPSCPPSRPQKHLPDRTAGGGTGERDGPGAQLMCTVISCSAARFWPQPGLSRIIFNDPRIQGPSDLSLTLRLQLMVARRRSGDHDSSQRLCCEPREEGSGSHSLGCPTPQRKMSDLQGSPTSEREALKQNLFGFLQAPLENIKSQAQGDTRTKTMKSRLHGPLQLQRR